MKTTGKTPCYKRYNQKSPLKPGIKMQIHQQSAAEWNSPDTHYHTER